MYHTRVVRAAAVSPTVAMNANQKHLSTPNTETLEELILTLCTAVCPWLNSTLYDPLEIQRDPYGLYEIGEKQRELTANISSFVRFFQKENTCKECFDRVSHQPLPGSPADKVDLEQHFSSRTNHGSRLELTEIRERSQNNAVAEASAGSVAACMQ
jgi:hypothetical protein